MSLKINITFKSVSFHTYLAYLLDQNYKVTVYDTLFFGSDFLVKSNENLNIVQGDIRDKQKLEKASKEHDFFVSLACISNDASFELNEELSTSINLEAFEPMVQKVLAKPKASIYKGRNY